MRQRGLFANENAAVSRKCWPPATPLVDGGLTGAGIAPTPPPMPPAPASQCMGSRRCPPDFTPSSLRQPRGRAHRAAGSSPGRRAVSTASTRISAKARCRGQLGFPGLSESLLGSILGRAVHAGGGGGGGGLRPARRKGRGGGGGEDHSWGSSSRLRPEAAVFRWQPGHGRRCDLVLRDGSAPIGHPRYLGSWTRVEGIEAVDDATVRISFTDPDRELAMIMGGCARSWQAAQWQDNDFHPLRSRRDPDRDRALCGPTISSPGASSRCAATPDYWGADLPFRRGHQRDRRGADGNSSHDGTAMFEAFTAGILSTMRETSAQSWAETLRFSPRPLGRSDAVGGAAPAPPRA